MKERRDSTAEGTGEGRVLEVHRLGREREGVDSSQSRTRLHAVVERISSVPILDPSASSQLRVFHAKVKDVDEVPGLSDLRERACARGTRSRSCVLPRSVYVSQEKKIGEGSRDCVFPRNIVVN